MKASSRKGDVANPKPYLKCESK